MSKLSDDKALQKAISKSSGVKTQSRWPWVLALVIVVFILAFLLIPFEEKTADKTAGQKGAKSVAKGAVEKPQKPSGVPSPPAPSPGGKVVDLSAQTGAPSPDQTQDKTGGQAKEQAKRKKPYGLDKSLDAVVRSDESIRIGDRAVSLADLERKLVVEQRGELLDKPLEGGSGINAWGVHVVRPGENLWDIHYRLLREYLSGRGVSLPEHADRPDQRGRSSGVGKILKFAEHMVGVYNVKTGRMSANLNQLEPGHKVVVFNLTEIFQQLAKINPRDLSGVMYDGRVLMFPAENK